MIARIGKDALATWDDHGIMPQGWSPGPEKIGRMWQDFSDSIHNKLGGSNTLVITSNGIARFALQLTGNWHRAQTEHGLKLATGALGILTRKQDDLHWSVVGWNIRP